METVKEVDDDDSPQKKSRKQYEKVSEEDNPKETTQDYIRLMSSYDEENLSELFMEVLL